MPETELSNLDITVRIELEGDSLEAALLAETVSYVEAEVFRSERDDLTAIGGEFTDLPRVAVDAVLQRLPQLKGHALVVTKVEEGCILLRFVLHGLAYMLLQGAVSEFEQTLWKKINLKERLKAFLLRRNKTKGTKFEQQIKVGLPRRLERKGYWVEVESNVAFSDEGGTPDLQVHVRVSSPKLPTRGQVLNGWDPDPVTSRWLDEQLQPRSRRDSGRDKRKRRGQNR